MRQGTWERMADPMYSTEADEDASESGEPGDLPGGRLGEEVAGVNLLGGLVTADAIGSVSQISTTDGAERRGQRRSGSDRPGREPYEQSRKSCS